MGFIYRGKRKGNLIFEVRGRDILYAIQFAECSWEGRRVMIRLEQVGVQFVHGDEYFLALGELGPTVEGSVDNGVELKWCPEKMRFTEVVESKDNESKNKTGNKNEKDDPVLTVPSAKIECYWNYETYVPEFPKEIDDDLVEFRLHELKKTEQDLRNIISHHRQPTFWPTACKNGDDLCKARLYPKKVKAYSRQQGDSEVHYPYFCRSCVTFQPVSMSRQT